MIRTPSAEVAGEALTSLAATLGMQHFAATTRFAADEAAAAAALTAASEARGAAVHMRTDAADSSNAVKTLVRLDMLNLLPIPCSPVRLRNVR